MQPRTLLTSTATIPLEAFELPQSTGTSLPSIWWSTATGLPAWISMSFASMTGCSTWPILAAHLQFLGLRHLGALNHFDSLVGQFQAAYEAGTKDYSDQRLRLYKAITYFKLGRFVALVQQPDGWRQMLPELLDAARCLV